MMTKEMRRLTEDLMVQYGEDGCEHCPYAEQCGAEELFWGCGVWEEQMGEDL